MEYRIIESTKGWKVQQARWFWWVDVSIEFESFSHAAQFLDRYMVGDIPFGITYSSFAVKPIKFRKILEA